MSGNYTWQKSSFSGGGDGAECLEVTRIGRSMVALREGDAPDVVLTTTPSHLAHLIRRIKLSGEGTPPLR